MGLEVFEQYECDGQIEIEDYLKGERMKKEAADSDCQCSRQEGKRCLKN